jgi:hypothetical protein
VKTDTSGLDRFLWFIENWLVTVKKSNFEKKIKNKNLKIDKLEKSSDKSIKPVGLPFYSKFKF